MVNYHKDKEAWLEERKKGIGASEASSILGLNPFCTPFKLWANKTGLLTEQVQESEAMEWGQALETPIALKWAEKNGVTVRQCGDLIKHDKSPLFATPDFEVVETDNLLECKLTNDYKGYADDSTPDYVQIQVAVQLLCTGRDAAHIAALLKGTKLLTRYFVSDLELQGLIVEKALEFWKLVETRTPPALQAEDCDLVGDLYPTHPNMSKELDASLEAKIERFINAKSESKIKSDEVKKLQAELRMALGEYSSAKTPNGYGLSSTIIKSTRLDTDRIKKEVPDFYSNYAKLTSYERFSAKTPKITTK